MSPEQIREGGVVTPQTDLWSVGVVLFEALSGKVPFAPAEQDKIKILMAVMGDQAAPDLSDEVGAVTDGMAEFVAHALQKDLADRFPTAQEMTKALELVLQTAGDDAFGLFISYRVWCDKDFAEALFRAASKCQLRPGREHRMKVYLDKVRIVDGQRFDENFIKGLASSAARWDSRCTGAACFAPITGITGFRYSLHRTAHFSANSVSLVHHLAE